MSQPNQHASGPPYASTTASLGGLPTVGVDVAPDVVFIVLFASFAVTNMTILQLNLRKGHKFIISGMIFGFCMARIVTLSLRIGWAVHPTNARLAIAANIFLNAGILIIYVVNVIFAQRILRAKQPRLGWNPVQRGVFKALYAVIGACLAMLITSVVLNAYTLNPRIKSICSYILRGASTYFLVFATLPWFLVGAAWLLPRSPVEEHFGHGSVATKSVINVLSTALCVLSAGFKAGSNWMPPRPRTHPPWYDSKAALYVFVFTLEILIVCLLTFSRVDKRFHVPNGSKKPGDYTQLALKPAHHDASSMEEGPAEAKA